MFRLLDLFCGAGGAAMGYANAGFEVFGIDIEPQKHYPFPFSQQDALEVDLDWIRENFDAVHASPPCQKWSSLSAKNGREYPDYIGPIREKLLATDLPFVIENVQQAPLRKDLKLCGSMFGLGSGDFYLMRHRIFEIEKFVCLQPECKHKVGKAIGVYGHGRWDNNKTSFGEKKRRGGYQGTIEEKREAMDIYWMNRNELSQAIPPKYTEFIGGFLWNFLATDHTRGRDARGRAD